MFSGLRRKSRAAKGPAGRVAWAPARHPAILPGLLLALAAPAAVAQDAPPAPAADALGKQVFDYWCGICHGLPNGASGGGTETLAALYRGTEIPAQLEDRSDLTEELVVTLTRDGRNTMPNFRKTEISDAELAALVAYLVRDSGE